MSKTKTGKDNKKRGKLKIAAPFIFVYLLLLGGVTFGQSVYVKASIDRDKILIGEPIRLGLEASVPADQTATWFTLDSIPKFDIIETGKIDTTTNNGNNIYRQTVIITCFDSGRWVVPVLALEQNGRSYLTDSIPVSVAFSNFDPKQPYHDIKDILSVATTDQTYILWCIIIVTILSLLILIYLLRKPVAKKVVSEKTYQGSATALEQAIKALEELRAKKLPESGQSKAYYTGMNDILREFITRKDGISVMEKTNDELSLILKDRGMANDAFISLAQVLRMSDAVKFAKYVPGAEDNDQSFSVFRKSIETLNH